MKRFDGYHCFKYQASRAQKRKQGFLIPVILTGLTTLCGISLSTPSTMAESSSASAAVIVVSACSLSATNTVPHTASIPPGTYQADIGSTTLKAFCNDQGGFAIYAIGYTDTTYGKNTLTANINNELIPSSDIATGTATSGSTSNWAMKLATNSGATYPISLNNGFGAYSAVPASYTKVASRESGTDAGSGATGAELTTTYAAFMESGQEAGTYSGKVKYTMVHPYNGEAPLQPQQPTIGCINYFANASTAQGTMGTQCNLTDGASITLYASNFSRTGYGFAGWSDAFDYATNPNANFYGPNEDIVVPTGTTANGLALYAVWVKSTGSLQDADKVAELCGTTTTNGTLVQAPTDGTANLSSVSALTDQRDNQTYAIAKLADGKCWMIENLRLDGQYTVGNNQTNPSVTNASLSQGYNPSFIGLADPESANFTNSTTANSLYSIDGSTASTISGSYQGYRFPRYNNNNTSQRAANTTNTNVNTYSYGNYYTWHAVIADTTHYTSGNHNTTSICPTGWTLPRGGNKGNEANNDYWGLVVDGINNGTKPANYESSASPNYTGNPEGSNASAALRAYPNNFLYSGYLSSSASSRGRLGSYWSSTALNAINSYRLYLDSSYVGPGTGNGYKYTGSSARCVVSQ